MIAMFAIGYPDWRRIAASAASPPYGRRRGHRAVQGLALCFDLIEDPDSTFRYALLAWNRRWRRSRAGLARPCWCPRIGRPTACRGNELPEPLCGTRRRGWPVARTPTHSTISTTAPLEGRNAKRAPICAATTPPNFIIADTTCIGSTVSPIRSSSTPRRRRRPSSTTPKRARTAARSQARHRLCTIAEHWVR